MHKAVYGKVAMLRDWCEECKTHAFVRDGKMMCCDRPHKKPEHLTEKKMTCNVRGGSRRRFKKKDIDAVLAQQNNRCIYCDAEFGSQEWNNRRKAFITIQPRYDHFIPWSYTYRSDGHNLVAACQRCNGRKGDKMFDSIEDAVRYLRPLRDKEREI